jgi:hypothetical protein
MSIGTVIVVNSPYRKFHILHPFRGNRKAVTYVKGISHQLLVQLRTFWFILPSCLSSFAVYSQYSVVL